MKGIAGLKNFVHFTSIFNTFQQSELQHFMWTLLLLFHFIQHHIQVQCVVKELIKYKIKSCGSHFGSCSVDFCHDFNFSLACNNSQNVVI